VRYDNATDAYAEAVAGTGWQLLSVTFTPTTSYGQVTVTISGRTDATGSDAYFYADDMAVLLPAGYKLDLGGLDLWADALPITPPIATVLSANDVWTAATSTLTGAGTIGKFLLDALDAAVSSRAATGDAMTLTAAYDRAKTALALSEYTAPANADIATLLSRVPGSVALEATLEALKGSGWTTETLVALAAAIAAKLDASAYTAPPSAADVAAAVLDEPVTGHTGWLTKLLSVAKFLGLK
jgi:hypothetical protein